MPARKLLQRNTATITDVTGKGSIMIYAANPKTLFAMRKLK
jgi:hypothetical protein